MDLEENGHLCTVTHINYSFRFDGIHYDRCVDTATGALPLKLDAQVEYPKMEMIWQVCSECFDHISGKKMACHSMVQKRIHTMCAGASGGGGGAKRRFRERFLYTTHFQQIFSQMYTVLYKLIGSTKISGNDGISGSTHSLWRVGVMRSLWTLWTKLRNAPSTGWSLTRSTKP